MVRSLVAICIIVLLYSCGGSDSWPNAQTGDISRGLITSGTATIFQNRGPVLGGSNACENELLNINGEIVALFDPWASGEVFLSYLAQDGHGFSVPAKVAENKRWPNITQYNNTFYMFHLNQQTGNLDLSQSNDLLSWTHRNSNVLTHSSDATSDYYLLFNVSAAVDDNGIWHMLSDCQKLGADIGLCYSTSQNFNFDTNRKTVHPRWGAPFVKFLPGKGLLAFLCGMNTPIDGIFSITAATLPIGSSAWEIHEDTFKIGIPGVHVCDPSAVETNEEKTLLTMSVNQKSTYMMESGLSMSQIFDTLRGTI